MKLCVALLVLAAYVCAGHVVPEGNSAYGYITNYGIPRGEQIRKAEESQTRIIGGVPAAIGQYPFFGGLLGDVIGLDGTSVCGASLISVNRLVTAAHCWFDGVHQIWRLTVVVGSTTLFSGGTRVQTSVVAMHPNWSPSLARNDVAVIYLLNELSISNIIAPVALPSGDQLSDDFSGNRAIAAGYGVTSAGQVSQVLNHVSFNVITNSLCSIAFPFIIQNTNICTSGLGGNNICSGDSGGPLVINRDGNQILIGVSSFVSALGCDSNLPGVYARVTPFVDFLLSHL